MTTKINPKREYSAHEIIQEKIFPWATRYSTLKLLIGRDMNGDNILETQITGVVGTGQRYSIKGKNINRFLKKYGSYLGAKPKQHENKRNSN